MRLDLPRRRPGLRHLTAGVMCVLAGLLFATTANTAHGTDLRPGERGDLTDLVRAEQQRIADANGRVEALRAEVSARAAEVEAAQPGGPDPAEQAREQALAPAEAASLHQSNYDTSEPADGWIYSTLAESPPAVELVTDMLGSTAIISARMSRMG